MSIPLSRTLNVLRPLIPSPSLRDIRQKLWKNPITQLSVISGPQGWVDWRNFRAEPLGLDYNAFLRIIELVY
jgi:hypothetical protein